MSEIIQLDSGNPHVALVEIRKPPYNFLSIDLLTKLADALDAIDEDGQYRCTILASEGKVFCAGAELSGDSPDREMTKDPFALYRQALRVFKCKKPLLAAVQGPAVGAGLGLAMAADFRITCPEARFVANFTRLGFHPGFGLSHTLPKAIGLQHASEMLYTGRRIGGEEAVRIGLADKLVEREQVRASALAMAGEIAISAPQAVMATRSTLRRGLVEEVERVLQIEVEHQTVHLAMDDFREGVAAMAERRDPVFRNR